MTPWGRFLHWLWRRVGEPGMQCHGPHISPGETLTVRWVADRSFDQWTGVVNSVTCYGGGPLATHIVLRHVTTTEP